MKRLCVILTLIISLTSFAGEYDISLSINGFGGQFTYLTKVEGDLSIITDTLVSNSFGLFKTKFTDDDEVGFYKFIFPQLNNAEIEFIFNKENVSLSSEVANPSGYIQVLSSKENDLYYQFLAKNAILNNQVSLLEMVYDNYVGEEFRTQTEEEYQRLVQNYANDIGDLYKRGKDTYVWHVIKSSRIPLPPMLLSQSEKNIFLKAHYLDDVDFSDTLLINSDVFTTATLQYLSIFTSQIQQSNKNIIFMTAVDSVLVKAQKNNTVYDFIVDFLLGGFESMGASEIVSYISEKYLTEQTCGSDDNQSTLRRKALSNTELAIGKYMPLELLQTMNYKNDVDFGNENVVVIFWATWCGHCVETVPEIVKQYVSIAKPKYTLVTVSLDTNTIDWEQFLDSHKDFTKTKNFIDTDGWDGKVAETYHLYATPTIFFLQKGKIVAKPIDFDEYKQSLKKLKWE